ncbi:polyribonucleotide nucleotidyltransferase [Candidatus Babeliales bacterium]|nr:polyribonucleotide nucleotidyltransferase [Candidatus Babeliales bacterium]
MKDRKFELKELGLEVEIGKFANQADGAAWVKQGGTVVLATATSAKAQEFPGFLPLTVDYREYFSSAGKIPGGYFKREGKFTDKEVLTGRLIDRAIRPLFPEDYFNSVQVLNTVYSADKENPPTVLAFLATSIALTISKIPLLEPVGLVEMARVDGKWVQRPTYDQSLIADSKILIAGTKDGLCMVEGNMHEISESDLVDLFFEAHEVIQKQISWQEEIRKAVGVEKEQAENGFDWNVWTKKAQDFITPARAHGAFIADKIERGEYISQLKDEFLIEHKVAVEGAEISKKVLENVFEKALSKALTDAMFEKKQRLDGRDFEAVRKISVEVGLLPATHGSALFTRGRTQALVTATLGSGQDEQRVEELMGDTVERNFMLHYNFPPFSVGEVRPQRGPGRREIGHGFLAASALKAVLPSEEEFPYTIRLVADMLESDGSTSMATTCGSTMALMHAGVPIRAMVSGIAMGLLRSPKGDFQALTDIAGIEDAFGLMDFKVTGTDAGITAIQMDIKYKGGLPREVFERALAQAKRGREHILGEMRKVMTKPNPELSDMVPKVVSFKIPTDKIGAVIGKGGSVIRDIIEKTSCSVDIEDDGTVKIFGQPGLKLDQAVSWVKILGGIIEVGRHYPGIIKRFADFGIFVELAPGQDGLVHISTIPRHKQQDIFKTLQPEDAVTVEVLDYDEVSGRIRLKLVE